MKTVLFACMHNAGRSQMAARIFNALADPEQARAISAGTEPALFVHPVVAEAMAEIGLDLSRAVPRILTDEFARGASLLVTMGCGEQCPFVPGLEVVDWDLPDPKDRPLPEVRVIRDTIGAQVEQLVEERGWARAPTGAGGNGR
jgi:arsenate reductase